MRPPGRLQVLLVEDNEGDQLITREVLAQPDGKSVMHIANDGAEALDFLFRRGAFANVPRPHLIIMDLNLPKIHGLELLARLRVDISLKRIPVVILTTSDAQQDIDEAYDRGASAYCIKPADVDAYFDLLGCIQAYWYRHVQFAEAPPGNGSSSPPISPPA